MLSAREVKEKAAEVGFCACGLAPAGPLSAERAGELRAWLAEGNHGEMKYLERNLEMRLNPQLLVEGARTVVSVAANYFPGNLKELAAVEPGGWKLARYAYGTDYHMVVKRMLGELMGRLGLQEGESGRCFTDTAPVDEKYWAQQCGLGWRGRNGQIILPEFGSYVFLGELILREEADEYDSVATNRCGSCRRCVEACPGNALLGDGTMDARSCLSYLTIEYRGALPEGTGGKMGDCLYGCDRCSEVCPWNGHAVATKIGEFAPRAELLAMRPEDWLSLTEEEYRKLFRKSAVKRAKFEGLRRNIAALSSGATREGVEEKRAYLYSEGEVRSEEKG